jgi:hypothetical protein
MSIRKSPTSSGVGAIISKARQGKNFVFVEHFDRQSVLHQGF